MVHRTSNYDQFQLSSSVSLTIYMLCISFENSFPVIICNTQVR